MSKSQKDQTYKNKHGMTLRIGQKFESHGRIREIIDFRHPSVIYWNESTSCASSTGPLSNHFGRLVYDPKWGSMDGWTIVTEEQKEKYKIPKEAQAYAFRKNTWGWHYANRMDQAFLEDTAYRVPEKFTGWELIKPEDPPFKLFEIDWESRGGCVIKSEMGVYPIGIGVIICGYRIFGYLNSSKYDGSRDCSRVPCTHKTDFKYAIGKLIK